MLVSISAGVGPDPHPEEPVADRGDQNSRKSDYREEVQVYKLTGGVELVPLLMSGRYNHSQPHSTRYIATDATRPGYTIDRYVMNHFSSQNVMMRSFLVPPYTKC